jgi:hypothetical protein
VVDAAIVVGEKGAAGIGAGANDGAPGEALETLQVQ